MADTAFRENDDMFFKVESAKQGVIKGEANDLRHKDEIQIFDWSWGMEAQSALSGGGESTKATIKQLNIVKAADSASTALMSVLHNNDLIKKAVLTVRKAGKTQHEYYKITIEKGRVISLNVRPGPSGGVVENLSFAFQKVKVEYIPQGDDGQPRGSTQFEAEIIPG